MPRWLLSAAVLTLVAGVSTGSAHAGLFFHGHDDDCAPSCAAPPEMCAPVCAAPTEPACYAPSECAPMVGPSCAVPCENYVEVGCCETLPPEREGCLKRCFGKLMDMERRKNRCLKDTFFGWCDDEEECHTTECAPVYYYQPDCAAPGCAVPTCAAP